MIGYFAINYNRARNVPEEKTKINCNHSREMSTLTRTKQKRSHKTSSTLLMTLMIILLNLYLSTKSIGTKKVTFLPIGIYKYRKKKLYHKSIAKRYKHCTRNACLVLVTRPSSNSETLPFYYSMKIRINFKSEWFCNWDTTSCCTLCVTFS